MGCSGSKKEEPKPAQPQVVEGTMVAGEDKTRPKRKKESKFQIKLESKWQDYEEQENAVLTRAYMTGQANARYSLRGQDYEYNFKKNVQTNLKTKKTREIRPPNGLKKPPVAMLPPGGMVIITVRKGQGGKFIKIPDPNNKGKMIQVNVPKGAKAGQKMAVPIPAAGEDISAVQERQKKHQSVLKTGLKRTACVAAVGGVAVGGVILGDYLSDGAVADAAGEHLGEGVGGAVADATDWSEAAVADITEWTEDAAETIGDAAEDAGVDDAFEDAAAWLGDAAEDAGDFIMDIF